MSSLYLVLKLIHILSATVLFGTGLGIAFFMYMANRSGEPAAIAHTARVVVIADALFTATAVVVQPLTGWAMAAMVGYSTYHVGTFHRSVLDQGDTWALCDCRAVLAAGGVDPIAPARSCWCRRSRRRRAANSLSPVF